MSEPRNQTGLRVLMRLAAVAVLAPFIAAPTPGNVGGCGGSVAAQEVQPGPYQSTDPPETPEWELFDRGLCAGLCQRLRDCGVICNVIDPNEYAPGEACVNDSPRAFRACMRGKWVPGAFASLPDYYQNQCPHSCPQGTTLSAPPLEWDVQVCNDAVMQMACPTDFAQPGTVLDLGSTPGECLHLCQ